MKILLYFRRDDEGRVRLLHAYDEHEAQENYGGSPPSLLEAIASVNWRAGEASCAIQIDTDDPIIRGPEVQGFTGPISPLERVDFAKLLPPDPDPEHAPKWQCAYDEGGQSAHLEPKLTPCQPSAARDKIHDNPGCGWKR